MTDPTQVDQPDGILSLEVLNARLKSIVENRMRGEVVRVRSIAWDVTRSGKAHVYLRLRHGRYALSCVVLRRLARDLRYAPTVPDRGRAGADRRGPHRGRRVGRAPARRPQRDPGPERRHA